MTDMPMYDPPHPGRIVNNLREAKGWTVKRFAQKLGVSKSDLSDLLDGRCGITPEMARAIESAGGSRAAFWLSMQKGYDEAQIRMREEPPPVWDDISEIPPEDLPHPGVHMREGMEERGMSPAGLAKALGFAPSVVLGILNERAPVTPKIARALERADRGLAKHWLLGQRSHDESQALLRERERVAAATATAPCSGVRPPAPARRAG